MRIDHYHHQVTPQDRTEAIETLLHQLISRRTTDMATIVEAIAEVQAANAAKTEELKALIAIEAQQQADAINAEVQSATTALSAQVAELQAQIASGSAVTPEQIEALKAPFGELAVAIQGIVAPGAAATA